MLEQELVEPGVADIPGDYAGHSVRQDNADHTRHEEGSADEAINQE
jgi:hypothetical protein